MNASRRLRRWQAGGSYLEVLIAAVLIAIVLVPMMDALQGASSSAEQHEELSTQNYHLTAKLEDVLAQSYSTLADAALAAGSETVPTSYSDSSGSTNRRLVYLSLYDGDNADADGDSFTGVDDGLIWVRVEIEGTLLSIESLTSQ